MNQEEFEQKYLNPFLPKNLVDWLENFCDELDCEYPSLPFADPSEYLRRVGAWEAQMFILKKLRCAIKEERKLTKVDREEPRIGGM